ncbi:family 1 glycosylhydrolase [Plantibacter sp. YIM 135249]|uniref:family 1 glycosylhydrolase n=1 Tax=Plantibacter sp. YIM 135249 TaxID=3423918 RepID=UPI003D32CD16
MCPLSRPRAHLLPADFVWGVTTSAFQFDEPAARSTSLPRRDPLSPTFAVRGTNMIREVSHHARQWEADLDGMAELQIPALHLSLSWEQLQPSGAGPLNRAAVAFYRDIFEGARERSLDPFVALYHWGLPRPLLAAGGWHQRRTAEQFAQYAALVISEFSDVVSTWITIYEPWSVAFAEHARGACGADADTEARRALHHLLLGHGLALRKIRDIAPRTRVGIANTVSNVSAASDSTDDQEAAAYIDLQLNRIVLDPLYLGRNEEIDEVLGPVGGDEEDINPVRPGDLDLISTPADFAGVNHFINVHASTAVNATALGACVRAVEPATTATGWSNTPAALREVLNRVSTEYTPGPVYVTGSGASFEDAPAGHSTLDDSERINYLDGYTGAVLDAYNDGVDVRGYFVRSFVDTVNCDESESSRFGLVHVDHRTDTRTTKRSAHWYRDLIVTHRTARGR